MSQEFTSAGIGTVAALPGGWCILVVLDGDRDTQLRVRCNTQESGLAWGKSRWPEVQWLPEMDYLTTVDSYARQG